MSGAEQSHGLIILLDELDKLDEDGRLDELDGVSAQQQRLRVMVDSSLKQNQRNMAH